MNLIHINHDNISWGVLGISTLIPTFSGVADIFLPVLPMSLSQRLRQEYKSIQPLQEEKILQTLV